MLSYASALDLAVLRVHGDDAAEEAITRAVDSAS